MPNEFFRNQRDGQSRMWSVQPLPSQKADQVFKRVCLELEMRQLKRTIFKNGITAN